MEINENTKLKDILAEHPELKERLTEINPKFKKLSSPMGKIMIEMVTIGDMSNTSGTEINELISGIKKIIGE